MFLIGDNLIMKSESRETILKTDSKTILVFIVPILIISLLLFKNLSFKSTYLLKSFGDHLLTLK